MKEKENMMDAYFIEKGVDISREVLLKNGQIDFKLFRNNKIDDNAYTDTIQMYINIAILDVRKKISPSKSKVIKENREVNSLK